jgi:hypothetical protein
LIPDHIFESLETIFWVKIHKFFDADPADADGKNSDPGWKKFGSGNTAIKIMSLPRTSLKRGVALREQKAIWDNMGWGRGAGQGKGREENGLMSHTWAVPKGGREREASPALTPSFTT